MSGVTHGQRSLSAHGKGARPRRAPPRRSVQQVFPLLKGLLLEFGTGFRHRRELVLPFVRAAGVDDDIDPSNLWDVTWAMASRCDPDEDIDIIRKAWSGALDPRKRVGDNFNSRAIVDACRPYEWKDEFPPVAESSPDLKQKTYEKWKDLLD